MALVKNLRTTIYIGPRVKLAAVFVHKRNDQSVCCWTGSWFFRTSPWDSSSCLRRSLLSESSWDWLRGPAREPRSFSSKTKKKNREKAMQKPLKYVNTTTKPLQNSCKRLENHFKTLLKKTQNKVCKPLWLL